MLTLAAIATAALAAFTAGALWGMRYQRRYTFERLKKHMLSAPHVQTTVWGAQIRSKDDVL